MIGFGIDPQFQKKARLDERLRRKDCETMELLFPESCAQFDTGYTATAAT